MKHCYKYIFIIVFTQFMLTNQFSLAQQLTNEDIIISDSVIRNTLEIERGLNVISDVDIFILELKKIKTELHIADSLIVVNELSTLNNLVRLNSLQHFSKDYYYFHNEPFKKGDTLEVEYSSIQADWPYFEIAENYIRTICKEDTNFSNVLINLGLSNYIIQDQNYNFILKDYPSLKEYFKITFRDRRGYNLEVDPLPDLRRNKEKYLKLLLSLIEELLNKFELGFSFQDYINVEQKLEPLSIDQRIKIRHDFLNQYYEEFYQKINN